MASETEKKSRFKPKTYVITSAQAKASVNKNFLDGLERLCEERDGEIRIKELPGKDIGENWGDGLSEKDIEEPEKIKDYEWIIPRELDGKTEPRKKEKYNDNVMSSDIIVPPQNLDPATGQGRFVRADSTSIVAHTKQRLKCFPCSNYNFPKLFVSTGAITHPRYNIDNDRGNKALKDHDYGAILVEVLNDEFYNIRNIIALDNGKFVDLGEIRGKTNGVLYNGKGRTEKATLEALVLGDIHLGDHDPLIMKANYEMIEELEPKRIFLHDLFNGHSINHHSFKEPLRRARLANEGKNNLEKELLEC